METLINIMYAPVSYFFILNSSGGEEALPTDSNYEQFDPGISGKEEESRFRPTCLISPT
jgi:hypothetical protein